MNKPQQKSCKSLYPYQTKGSGESYLIFRRRFQKRINKDDNSFFFLGLMPLGIFVSINSTGFIESRLSPKEIAKALT